MKQQRFNSIFLTGIVGVLLFTMTLNLKTAFSGDAATAKKKAGQPKLIIKETTFDAGVVNPGDKVLGTYLVENQGTADLVLKRVAPT